MKNTKIVAGFPATGKSYIFNNEEYSNDLVILDSDSSNFSWIKDKDGNNTKDRNPDFPQNYMKHIKDNIGVADIIFVSSHDVVQDALKDNNIQYTMVYPDVSLKEEWIDRFERRGNNEGFIKFISENWTNFISDIESNDYHNKIKLSSGEFIEDYIDDILA